MPQPLRPDPLPEPVPESEPLAVAKINAKFPEAFRAGQRFALVCLLNRRVNPYEERLIERGPFNFKLVDGQLTADRYLHLERNGLDNFSVTDLNAALQSVSELAAAERREADAQIAELAAKIEALNAELA